MSEARSVWSVREDSAIADSDGNVNAMPSDRIAAPEINPAEEVATLRTTSPAATETAAIEAHLTNPIRSGSLAPRSRIPSETTNGGNRENRRQPSHIGPVTTQAVGDKSREQRNRCSDGEVQEERDQETRHKRSGHDSPSDCTGRGCHTYCRARAIQAPMRAAASIGQAWPPGYVSRTTSIPALTADRARVSA